MPKEADTIPPELRRVLERKVDAYHDPKLKREELAVMYDLIAGQLENNVTRVEVAECWAQRPLLGYNPPVAQPQLAKNGRERPMSKKWEEVRPDVLKKLGKIPGRRPDLDTMAAAMSQIYGARSAEVAHVAAAWLLDLASDNGIVFDSDLNGENGGNRILLKDMEDSGLATKRTAEVPVGGMTWRIHYYMLDHQQLSEAAKSFGSPAQQPEAGLGAFDYTSFFLQQAGEETGPRKSNGIRTR